MPCKLYCKHFLYCFIKLLSIVYLLNFCIYCMSYLALTGRIQHDLDKDLYFLEESVTGSHDSLFRALVFSRSLSFSLHLLKWGFVTYIFIQRHIYVNKDGGVMTTLSQCSS